MKLVGIALLILSFNALAAKQDYLCLSSVAVENKAAYTILNFDIKASGGVKSAVRKEYSYEGDLLSEKTISILDASEYRSVERSDEKLIVLMDDDANFYNCGNEAL